ncbi:Membrane protein involved in the export of O-antigen and teichoic acid [Mariprofundus ferrinatatus]|uniref:Membrane protein involved in the export of O-antigen and teichoic acid n=1 Tax=Mariprofundus ferrinatatus TaxID=1921087 RepID=A0A2K8L3V8_9PROT|nr:polysaccharide biosynthesis C-terminal domain-containing protein [Mariprofundus ferrinatatus]ATX82010.1 Membrane protein involved in the export of O-antigen and teichoic acid [Mariprofundus ferrinatatus]
MKHLLIILGSFAFASILQVANTVLLGRALGISAVGEYGVFLSSIMLMAVLFQFGVRDFSTIQFSGGEEKTTHMGALLRVALMMCSIMAVLLFVVSSEPGLSLGSYEFILDHSISFSIAVALLVISSFFSGVALVKKDFVHLGFFRDYGRHFATFLLVIALYALPELKNHFYFGWTALFLILFFIFSLRYMPILKDTLRDKGGWSASFKKSSAYYFNDVLLNITALGDVLLLALFLAPTDLGIYFVCSRIAVLMNIFLTVVGSHNSPALAKLLVKGDHVSAADIMSLTSKMLVFVSVPLVALIFLFGPELLLLWGIDETNVLILELLFLGRFFNIITGNIGKYFVYSEKRHVEVVNNLISIALMFALIIWLVPSYGVLGAAIANALVLIIANIIKYIEFRYFFSIGYIGFIQVYYSIILIAACVLFAYFVDVEPILMTFLFFFIYLGLTFPFANKDFRKYLIAVN